MTPDPAAPSRTASTVRLAAGLIAVAICAVITTLKLNGAISSLAGCGAAGGCEAALGGRWSQWLGIPVTRPAHRRPLLSGQQPYRVLGCCACPWQPASGAVERHSGLS